MLGMTLARLSGTNLGCHGVFIALLLLDLPGALECSRAATCKRSKLVSAGPLPSVEVLTKHSYLVSRGLVCSHIGVQQ